jgi:hydroxyacylglutathione hydrolase
MFVQRVFTEGLAQASFVIGSERTGEAVVIDPRRDVQVYLDIAAAHNLRITHVYETHIHADYASGTQELVAASGATAMLSAAGQSNFAHQPVHDGDEQALGELRFRALLTPGHTPEHISILVSDSSQPDDAPLLFTGDALFVGAVGRPDLLGESQTQALAHALYRTVHETFMRLDDDIIVYPGHGAGSACGKAIGDAPSTTMGQEKRFNYAFQPMEEEQFVALMLDGLPDAPPYFPVMKKLNKRGAPVLNGIPQPPELGIDALCEIQRQGEAILVDVRESTAFGSGFLRGALNIGLGPSLPNWAGWAVSYERPIALIVTDAGDVAEAVTWLIRIGLDQVTGYAVANPGAWREAGLDVAHVPQLQPSEGHARLADGDLHVLDVRNDDEWEQGHVPGARHIPLGDLATGQQDGLRTDQPVAVMCAAGYRSSLGTSILKARGFETVYNLSGGLGAWQEAGLPVE